MSEYIKKLLAGFIRKKTVSYNPEDYPEKGPDGMQSPGEEYKVAKIVEREFSKLGIKYKIFNRGKRPDVIAFIGQNKPGYRRLLLAAHMDTVPAGEGWTVTKPFVPKVVGSRMYGRGVLDNKGPLAALIAAAALLKKKPIKGQIMVAAVSDEEVNMCLGLLSLIKKKIIKPTDAIIPDVSTSLKKITVAEKGIAVIVVRAEGKAAHASTPELGWNAIAAMSEFLLLLSRYQLRHKHDPLFPDGPTINIGLVKGGDAHNKVPAVCEAVIDIRHLPSNSLKEILAELRHLSKEVTEKKVRFSFKLRDKKIPFRVSSSAPVISAIKKHCPAKEVGTGGGTISKLMFAKGIDSVGFGPGDEHSPHMADEYIDLRELERFSKLIAEIAIDISNTKTF